MSPLTGPGGNGTAPGLLRRFRNRFIGDRRFYRTLVSVALPIVIQNGVSNFVSLLDNVMVGRLSTESMSGVSIVNQFLFVFYLAVFGALSGPGIYTAQFHGAKNEDGVRKSFILKLYIGLGATAASLIAFSCFGEQFIQLFLHDGSLSGDLALTLTEGKAYLSVILWGLVPYVLSMALASTLRETGRTLPPMVASVAAVGTNLLLNWILIFGMFGIPALGVVGAALATVISRVVELTILVVWVACHRRECVFATKIFRNLRIGRKLAGIMLVKSVPLLVNESMYALSLTVISQCYSTRGLDVVAAQNIASTLSMLLNVVFISVGTSVSIIVGGLLGAGKLEEAKVASRRLIFCSALCAVFTMGLMAASAPFFPLLYNTTDDVRRLATYFLFVSACILPSQAVCNAAYFTLRSGGRILWTVLSDSGVMWSCSVSVTAILCYGTGLDIHVLYPICQATNLCKAATGLILLHVLHWARKIVDEEPAKPAKPGTLDGSREPGELTDPESVRDTDSGPNA